MKTTKPLHFHTLPTLCDGKKPGVFNQLVISRAQVPGGWLIALGGGARFDGVTFYPEPEHKWDGGGLD